MFMVLSLCCTYFVCYDEIISIQVGFFLTPKCFFQVYFLKNPQKELSL